jgi:lysozyme
LNQHQLDALISFTFNCGEGSLAASTLRKRLNRREYAAVPQELNKWVMSGGKRLPGLVRRRKAEGALFSHGKYN